MRGRRAVLWGTLANGLILIGILAPLIGLALGSIQTERDLFANVPHIWPKHVTAENLSALVLGVEVPGVPPHARSFPRAFANSAVVAIGVVLLTLLLATLAAYAIARLRFRGSETLAYWLLATRMVPLIVLIVPLVASATAWSEVRALVEERADPAAIAGTMIVLAATWIGALIVAAIASTWRGLLWTAEVARPLR